MMTEIRGDDLYATCRARRADQGGRVPLEPAGDGTPGAPQSETTGSRNQLSAEMAAFMGLEELPAAFSQTISEIFIPLSCLITKRFHELKRPCLVGLCGPQGSGKSTGAAILRRLLQADGLQVALLSLDDLYLTRAARRHLATTVHPLLITRGPPGTHDVRLGEAVVDRLLSGNDVALPSFDKAIDDRRPASQWEEFEGPADVVLFEGWCVGAAPQCHSALLPPINQLERELDPCATWRMFVNDALQEYQRLFARIDLLILLQPPYFEIVLQWRREQEAKLRTRSAPDLPGLSTMADAEVDRFVQHFERLTREIIREMPSRADAVVNLGPARQPRSLLLGSISSSLGRARP